MERGGRRRWLDRQVPAAPLDEAWRAVLLNQFHDILPGSSIRRVYEQAEAAYAQVHRHNRAIDGRRHRAAGRT